MKIRHVALACRGLPLIALNVALVCGALATTSGCYKRVVGVKGAGAHEYEVYEPSVGEGSAAERRAQERAKAKAEQARLEAERERKKEDPKK